MFLPADYVEVAVFSPLPGRYTYRWPGRLGQPQEGLRVRVPFGRRMAIGVIVGITRQEPGMETRDVSDRLDLTPLYDANRRRWLERFRRYYLAREGEAWELGLSWAAGDDHRRFRCRDKEALAEHDHVLAEAFRSKTAVTLKTIASRLSDNMIRYRVLSAAKLGLLEEEVPASPFSTASNQGRTAEWGATPLVLTAAQKAALDAIREGMGRFHPSLLFGRTGSGKTEVYLRAAESVVAEGGQVLILVPEIGLTPMWMQRVSERFPRAAVWHSGLSPRDRLTVRLHLPQTEVLIGTRSALFLPLPRLKMIVVDEEHDASLKQQEGIGYSARDMALLLAQELKIPIVLGSATPSLESWKMVRERLCCRLDLPDRIGPSQVHHPEIVDMRGGNEPLSPTLLQALEETRERKEQAILFLNRRGYAPALQCSACGEVPSCPHCSIRLTLHRRAHVLRCHACGYAVRVPLVCPACDEPALHPLGEGVEKIEEWLQKRMPQLRLARFDRDVITSHKRLLQTLEAFASHRIDCMIGTQMLVKGHHFPEVTLVGVINADLGLSLPDFRAGERWWQQMTQVMGRAGRGDKKARVIIQTRMPNAPWLARLGEDQTSKVLDEELELRRQLHFPPFARWVRLVVSSRKAEQAEDYANSLACGAARIRDLEISGPMPCAIERLAGRFRFEVLLRDRSRRILPWKLEPLLGAMPPPSSSRLRVDVDPLDMM